ncbi:hypothetical protein WDU94_007183 [Cyamophila willieti]
MVSIQFLCSSLERLGFINLQRETGVSPRKRTWRDIFMFVQYSLIIISFTAHLLSTITRSIRHSAEFVQTLFEDCFSSISLFSVNYLRVHYAQLESLLIFMENSFSKADRKIIARCENQCRFLLIVILAGGGCPYFGALLESLLPLSDKELEIRRFVYRTKYPERRHPYNVHYPFIDESTSWAFQIVLVHQTYVCVLVLCIISSIISIMPFLLLNLRAQYEILAKYIVKIGVKHRDSYENEIFYTNIMKDEFHISIMATNNKAKKRKIKLDKTALIKKQQEYERNYLKQIIQFHHNLLIFNEKVCISLKYLTPDKFVYPLCSQNCVLMFSKILP